MKIIIDPEDNIQYMSFYIKGLFDLFGRNDVLFDFDAFDDLPIAERNTRTMRFIIKYGSREMRYVIDANDSWKINDTLYRWCDRYGIVNANFKKTSSEYHNKMVSLCPSFDIRYTGVINAVNMALKGSLSTKRNKR